MINKLKIFILFIFLSNCSLDTKTGIWKESEKLENQETLKTKEVFKKKEIIEKEFNSNIRINLKDKFSTNSFINNLTNNNAYLNYDGKLKKVSKYNFSKISDFNFTQPELLFTKDKSIIFFDNKGTVIRLDENLKEIWKKNIYSKNEKKLEPILYFASNKNILLVADNISNYYALKLDNGELLWKKNNISPFNSQIKVFKDRFFAIDYNNALRCFSIKTGEEIWNFKSEKSFINSQQKLSMVIDSNKLVFINSLGDLTALDLRNGFLLWQTPTQSNVLFENAFSLKNSDIILNKKVVYFSNNKNETFSINFDTGQINWRQVVNSNIRPSIIGDLLFLVSIEGYLVVIDKNNGNIIRITNVFEKDNNVEPTGFVIGKKNIYLSLSNGRLIIINIADGKLLDLVKIDGGKISRGSIVDSHLYLIMNNSIVKMN